MESKWMVYSKRADFNELSRRFGITPVTARIIRNRDVCGEEAVRRYLYGTRDDLYSPHLLKDADKAAAILAEKISAGKRIRIVGDYDIDGICATYLLFRALTRLGARVDYEIPDRIRDGYGINVQIIEAAAAEGIDTILTCDNGISAVSQMERAAELGLTVIITDHHEIVCEEGKPVLPRAAAVLNPRQPDCDYPWKEICGAVVAYKLIRILYENAGVPLREWEEMLEFAAIATVGDVMRLQDENRILVKEGLKQIPRTGSVGLKKLVESNNLDIFHLTAYQIGFVIGPCLNASGRLQTAKLALRLLLCREEGEAGELASELKMLNDRRKDMTARELERAVEDVETNRRQDKVLVVYLPECHESLAGIIAGRLREQYNKPAFVLTRSEDGIKGSGRSIEAYPMFQSLCEVKELFTRFGGHPMAAGLSLASEDDVERMRRQLNERARLTEEDLIPKIWIDVPMPMDYVTEEFIRELELLEPYGNGNEKPQFAQKGLRVRGARVLGKNRNAVRLSLVTPEGTPAEAMVFTDGDAFMDGLRGHVLLDAVYYPTINEYNGTRTIRFVIKEWKFR